MLTAALVVGGLLAALWFYQHPEALEQLWATLKLALAWIGFVIVLPWALFFIVPYVLRAESNLVSALLLVGYLCADVLVAFWLAGWSVSGTLSWVVLVVGFLTAAVYNFLVCDFIASKAEDI